MWCVYKSTRTLTDAGPGRNAATPANSHPSEMQFDHACTTVVQCEAHPHSSSSCPAYGPRPHRHAAPHRAPSSIAAGSSMPAPSPYASAAANESPQP
jgi:hypothetical protein